MKMKNAIKGILGSAAALFVMGTAHVAGASPLVLEREFINFGWGYDHSGCAIDELGNVFKYDIQASMPLTITSSVDKDELENVLALSYKISKSELKRRHAAADGGTTSWVVNYGEKITLKISGDWEGEKNEPEAKTLIDFINKACDATP